VSTKTKASTIITNHNTFALRGFMGVEMGWKNGLSSQEFVCKMSIKM